MALDIMNTSRAALERIIQFFSSPVLGAFLFATALCLFTTWRLTRTKNKKFTKRSLPAEITKVPTFRKSKPLILKELSRTRRYQHSLSILVLNLEKTLPDDDKTVSLFSPQANNGDKHESSISHQTLQLGFMLAGTILHDALRESDIVTYDVSNNQFIVVLPETNKLQAQDAAKRLNRIF
jgi:GGDEF domain-containing protein